MRKLLLAIGLALLGSAPVASAELHFFFGEPRQSYWQSEPISLGLTAKHDVSGELSILAQAAGAAAISLSQAPVRLKAGETLLWELPPYTLRAGRYQLTAQLAGTRLTLPELHLAALIPISHFLAGSTASVAENLQVDATGINLDLYNYAKLNDSGRFWPDPLTPSGYEEGVDRVIAAGLRAWVWQGLWSGYVLHQPFESMAAFNDPDLVKVARQAAALGAQRARRFHPLVVSLGGMDESGLGHGVVTQGQFQGQLQSLWPDLFQRTEFEKETGLKLPPDPRTLPAPDWLKWLRWRSDLQSRFFTQAKRRIKDISPDLVWGQTIYAAAFLNDGAHPANQRVNDRPATHTFMFWRGVPEQAWNFALERSFRREERFLFASNTTYFHYSNPAEAPLAEVVTNYGVMDGVGQFWHLNFSRPENLQPSFRRLRRLGDFILATRPARHSIAVLYSFTEAALRLKATAGQSNEEIYRRASNYQQACGGLYHALRRSGYPADIVHEDELPANGLAGRKVLWLVGQQHPLPEAVATAIVAFSQQGGVVLTDATTTWWPAGIKVEPTKIDLASFAHRVEEATRAGQQLWDAGQFQEATRLTRQLTSDGWLDEAVPQLRDLLQKRLGPAALAHQRPGLIPGEWRAGEGRYYLLLNDTQQNLAEPEVSLMVGDRTVNVFPASDWGPAEKVELTLNRLKPGAAVYVLGGKDWRVAQPLMIQAGQPLTVNFEPTELKIFCVLPTAIEAIKVRAGIKATAGHRSFQVSGLATGQGQTQIKAAIPLEVIITDPAGRRQHYFRAIDETGNYLETFPLALTELPGTWQIEVRELLSGKSGVASLKLTAAPAPALRPAPEVQVFDQAAIRHLLESGDPIVLVLGDQAASEEQQVARQLATRLAERGVKVLVQPEAQVRRKSRYPKVFPAVEKRDEQWVDLLPAERELRRTEWTTMRGWAGENGYPPSLPDAYECDEHLILVGTDQSSTLIQALQRASILPRVANQIFPGRGRGLLEYAWSPFLLDKDVILVTGSDGAGVAKAADRLLSLAR